MHPEQMKDFLLQNCTCLLSCSLPFSSFSCLQARQIASSAELGAWARREHAAEPSWLQWLLPSLFFLCRCQAFAPFTFVLPCNMRRFPKSDVTHLSPAGPHSMTDIDIPVGRGFYGRISVSFLQPFGDRIEFLLLPLIQVDLHYLQTEC